MATQASAITLVGTTGQAYVDGMRFIQIYFGLPFAMVILCITLVPFFYKARVFTAYEYLEHRFDGKTRSLTSFLFLLSRGLADAVVIYAPSVVLSVVFGLDERVTILAIGLGGAQGAILSVVWGVVTHSAQPEEWIALTAFILAIYCTIYNIGLILTRRLRA